ncbi:TPM domain-containing protein [Microbacterium sp. NPDC096154]|uniref:TPM domain-containing protein n=1 Tax=Microbacterium sp. NPDC096154 TaxID=3155549 RepID=UPI00331A04CE
MRARRTVARRGFAVTGIAAALTLAALPASAEEPVQLGSGYVHDAADALSSAQEEQVDARLAQLASDTDLSLWVVYVDEFESPASAEEWANLTAERNNLGPYDYLLAVAIEGRAYYLSADSAGPLSGDRVGEIERDIQDELSASDWAGAAVATADELGGGAGGAGGAGGSATPWVIGGVGVVAIGATAWALTRRRRGAAPAGADPAGEPELSTDELARRASSALVATDDAVRASEQELGFAVAQFGADATGEFERALADAKANLAQAFELKQRLDDGEKDTEQEIRAWNAEIVHLCEAAAATLADKQAAFGELRRIEQDAPAALAEARRRRAAADGTAERVEAALAQLRTRYAADALATVADNPAQAEARLAFADQQLADAEQLIGTGDAGEAAVAIRNAEQAVAQAETLDKAVTDLGASLQAAEQQAAALIADLEQDVARARVLPGQGDLTVAVAAAEQAVAQARQNLSGPARSPQMLLDALQRANAQIDGLIANAQRAQQLLGQTLLQARSQVTGAEEYIAARRGAVGAEARTRLAEAGAELARAEALQTGDPAQALQRAQRALELATAASRLAQSDVQSAEWGGGMSGGILGGGGMLGGGRSGGMVDGIVGGLIGGLISGGMSGGSRSSGSSGWGGSLGGLGGLGGGSRARIGGGGFGGGSRGRRGGGRF